MATPMEARGWVASWSIFEAAVKAATVVEPNPLSTPCTTMLPTAMMQN